MRIIKANAYIKDDIDAEHIMRKLEACGRVCYKSEDKTTPDSAEAFVRRLIASGHESVLEHVSITAKFICDRGVSHEIVRHRIASYSQESTRYANYSNERFNSEITVIEPCMLSGERYLMWRRACEDAERTYMGMLTAGCTAQEARSVLPNSLKTELIMTANLREWRHFFKLRCAAASHPQMREVANILLKEMQERLPVVFGGITMTEQIKAALRGDPDEIVKVLRKCGGGKRACEKCKYNIEPDEIECRISAMREAANEINHLKAEIFGQADLIESLQAQLAERDAEIERLKQKSEVDTSDTLTPNAKWIDARHMLPGDDAGEVLAIVHGNPLANITLDGAYQLATHYPGDGWVVEDFPEWDEPIVTHWMPLPEPPQAGKEVRV